MDRDTYIFKRLKEHYNYIKDKYEVVGIFLQGSQNYGLDIYDDDYKSDIDTKAIVLPSLDDIVYNRKPISTTLILDNNEHIELKDIRIMFETFTKQNINYIEIIFTRFKIINPKYKKLLQPIFDNNERIARMDIVRALNCQTGMSKQKLTALKHPYPTIIAKIEKYGYDPKQLHHILRMNDFAKKYIAGKSYADCLIPDNKDYLIDIKKGVLSLKEAEELAIKTDEGTHFLVKQAIQSLENTQIDTDCLNLLNNTSSEIIKQYLQESMIKDSVKKEEKFIPKNIYITSDNHFYHSNIIEWECRPFSSVDEMNVEMVKLWNETVSNDDLVYILGDLSFGSPKETNELLRQLNGKKVLIVGNHDVYLDSKKFDKSLFLEIDYCKKIKVGDYNFYLCHYPFASNDIHGIQLYGHIHSNSVANIHHCDISLLPKNSYNVCADKNGYKPINIKDIIKIIKEQL